MSVLGASCTSRAVSNARAAPRARPSSHPGFLFSIFRVPQPCVGTLVADFFPFRLPLQKPNTVALKPQSRFVDRALNCLPSLRRLRLFLSRCGTKYSGLTSCWLQESLNFQAILSLARAVDHRLRLTVGQTRSLSLTHYLGQFDLFHNLLDNVAQKSLKVPATTVTCLPGQPCRPQNNAEPNHDLCALLLLPLTAIVRSFQTCNITMAASSSSSSSNRAMESRTGRSKQRE